MQIAIPLAGGQLAMHFGHCEQFALIDTNVEESTIVKTELVVPPPHEPGVLPAWLSEHGVKIVIAGGMGQRAVMLFNQKGIDVVVGAPSDTPENIVAAYLNGSLAAGENVCDH